MYLTSLYRVHIGTVSLALQHCSGIPPRHTHTHTQSFSTHKYILCISPLYLTQFVYGTDYTNVLHLLL